MRDLDRVRGGDAGGLGPAAAKECGLSLRRTPGMRQKVSATTPISSMQGGTRVKGVFIVPRHAGHDQRALRPQGSLERGDHPGRPPSTGLTFEKAQWTSSTPLGQTPRAWSWAIGVGETGWAGMRESYHSPHQSRNSGGRKTQGFQKSKALSRNRGRAICPFQRENRAPEGEYGFHSGSAAVETPNPEKRKRLLWKSWRKTPTAAPSLWNERELYGFQPRRLP